MIFSKARPAVNAKSDVGLGSRRFGWAFGAKFSGQAIGRRLNDLSAAVQRLVGQPPDRTGNTERPDNLPGKIRYRHRDATHFRIEFAVVKGDAAALDLGNFAQQHRNVGDRLRCRWFQVGAFKEALQLIRAQRGQDDLAERGTMGRPHHADAVGQLKCAGAAGARDHDDGVAHTHREMAAFAGFSRQLLEHRRRDIHHLDFVERAGGERKQWPADAVAFGIFLLTQIAQRHHGLRQMERGGIVQVDQLAEVRQPDALAVPRDLFEDRKGAAERLDADPLPIVGVVVDIALRRRYQLGDGGLARTGRLLTGLLLGTRTHRVKSPREADELYQAFPTTKQGDASRSAAIERRRRPTGLSGGSLPQYKLTYSIMGNRVRRAWAVGSEGGCAISLNRQTGRERSDVAAQCAQWGSGYCRLPEPGEGAAGVRPLRSRQYPVHRRAV